MRFSGSAGDKSRHFKSTTRDVGIARWGFAKGLRSDLLHSGMNTGLSQHHFPLPVPHQLLEHFMQIYAKESQQCAWETINIYEQSPHKSKGRGIYSIFFGDFSRCSLLSHCARLHKYSSDNKSPLPSVISSANRSSAGYQASKHPAIKMRDWFPTLPAPQEGSDTTRNRFHSHSRSLCSTNIHGRFGMQGTMVASQR